MPKDRSIPTPFSHGLSCGVTDGTAISECKSSIVCCPPRFGGCAARKTLRISGRLASANGGCSRRVSSGSEQARFLVQDQAHRNGTKKVAVSPLIHKCLHEGAVLKLRCYLGRDAAGDKNTPQRLCAQRQITCFSTIDRDKDIERLNANLSFLRQRGLRDRRARVLRRQARAQPGRLFTVPAVFEKIVDIEQARTRNYALITHVSETLDEIAQQLYFQSAARGKVSVTAFRGQRLIVFPVPINS